MFPPSCDFSGNGITQITQTQLARLKAAGCSRVAALSSLSNLCGSFAKLVQNHSRSLAQLRLYEGDERGLSSPLFMRSFWGNVNSLPSSSRNLPNPGQRIISLGSQRIYHPHRKLPLSFTLPEPGEPYNLTYPALGAPALDILSPPHRSAAFFRPRTYPLARPIHKNQL